MRWARYLLTAVVLIGPATVPSSNLPSALNGTAFQNMAADDGPGQIWNEDTMQRTTEMISQAPLQEHPQSDEPAVKKSTKAGSYGHRTQGGRTTSAKSEHQASPSFQSGERKAWGSTRNGTSDVDTSELDTLPRFTENVASYAGSAESPHNVTGNSTDDASDVNTPFTLPRIAENVASNMESAESAHNFPGIDTDDTSHVNTPFTLPRIAENVASDMESAESAHNFPGIDTDVTSHVNTPSTLPQFAAENVASHMESAVSARDVSENDTVQDTDEDPISGNDCITALAERLVSEASCVGEQWSCVGRCGQFRLLPCSCHALCHVYRTCCHDYYPQCLDRSGNSSDADHRADGRNVLTISTGESRTEVSPSSVVTSEEGGGAPNSGDANVPEQLETPIGECVPQIQARLVASCPKETPPQLQEACLALAPSQLSDVTPVTDPVAGLHFRNIHCALCWLHYWYLHVCEDCDLPPATAWLREVVVALHNGTYPETLRWVATLHVVPYEPRKEFTTISQYVEFLQDNSERVIWKHPPTFPSYRCKLNEAVASTDTCPACLVDPVTGSSKPTQCQNYLSYLYLFTPEGSQFYPNVHCFYCHLVETHMREKNGSGTTELTFSALKSLAQSLTCEVPLEFDLWRGYLLHNGAYSILLSWSSSSRLWSASNVRATKPLEYNSPLQGQVAWKELQCDDVTCSTQSCAPYSTMRDGVCTEDLIPYTSVVIVCLSQASNATRCDHFLPQQQQQSSTAPGALATVSSHPDPLTAELEKAILDALVQEAPWRFETGKEASEAATHGSDGGGVAFVYWSQTSVKEPSLYAMDEDAVMDEVVDRLRQMDVQGWVRVCLYDALYRTSMEIISQWKCEPEQVALRSVSLPSSAASSGRCGGQVFNAVCLLTFLGLFLSCWHKKELLDGFLRC